jgi:hypothetical protein
MLCGVSTATLALASNSLNAVERILTTGAKVQVEPNLSAAWAVDQPSNLQSEADGDPQTGRPLYDGHTRLVQGFNGQSVSYTIRYRGIDIVTYHLDGTVTLNAGDRPTRSIREQFAYYSPFSVTIEEGKWFVWVSGEGRVPFRNGMRLMRPGLAQKPKRRSQRGHYEPIPGFSVQFPPESVCAVFS